MTPTQARQRIESIQMDIDTANRKIRILRESMRGIPGIINRPLLEHDIEICQAAIIRLDIRKRRLELALECMPGRKYVPTDQDIFMMGL